MTMQDLQTHTPRDALARDRGEVGVARVQPAQQDV